MDNNISWDDAYVLTMQAMYNWDTTGQKPMLSEQQEDARRVCHPILAEQDDTTVAVDKKDDPAAANSRPLSHSSSSSLDSVDSFGSGFSDASSISDSDSSDSCTCSDSSSSTFSEISTSTKGPTYQWKSGSIPPSAQKRFVQALQSMRHKVRSTRPH